ncbi:hypothetical protein AURDEDRAFT_185287 [Auricularia subglabra TFB-10046 SS5]|nr:hypothetical protein AURDEDRAFT_185287 [Auricularia subglabra TFB-10046 SS5]
MTFASSAGRLPVEILSMIADHLDIQHLLTFSHVCVRWNAVARAHPVFWRDIRLAAVSDSALEFFQTRLQSAAGHILQLDLCIADHPFCDGIQNVIIPAVTRNLFRVVQLNLDMHSSVAPYIIPGLLEQAPLLESMGLRFFHHYKGEPAVILPPNLLAGACPRLVDLSLANVTFPEERIQAFQHVHFLMYHFRRRRIIPSGLFGQFPALQNLILMGNSHLRAQSTEGLLAVPPLNELELWLAQCAYDPLFSSFANLASVKHIVCRRPSDPVARQLVDHLRGPLELSFLSLLDDMVHIILHEPSFERVRSLVEPEQDVLEDMPHSVLFAPSLSERFQTLRICTQFAFISPHIGELPQCRTLEIILDSKFPSLAIAAPLRLPELCTVVVGNGEEHPTKFMTVNAEPLRQFLSQLLGVRPKRPSLRLHGVVIAGDTDELFRDFESVPS